MLFTRRLQNISLVDDCRSGARVHSKFDGLFFDIGSEDCFPRGKLLFVWCLAVLRTTILRPRVPAYGFAARIMQKYVYILLHCTLDIPVNIYIIHRNTSWWGDIEVLSMDTYSSSTDRINLQRTGKIV